MLRELVEANVDPELEQILMAGFNNLNAEKAVKGWSLIEYFFAYRRDEFFAFMRGMRQVGGWRDENQAKQKDQIQKAFGQDIYELEKSWREFVLRNY